ncbi:MAG TPA: hypothetical protein VG652_01345 [Gaiellaceae bacterium]|nr:hypothetical protein [Gaiellaceae bacterium]
MRNALVAVAVVALLSGCGGKSQPPVPSVNIATTTVPKQTHAQLVAAAAVARQVAKAAAKARAQGYTVRAGDPAGYKLLNTKLSHRGCSEFGNHGCWRVEIVTFKRCSFFEMDINEMRRGAVVETYVDNQSDVMPNTPLHGEFDATEDNVTLADPVFTCN